MGLLFVHILFLTSVAGTNVVFQPPKPKLCCGALLSPASDTAIIDTSIVIPKGEYNVIEVLTCNRQSFNLQLWRQLSTHFFQLVDQVLITPGSTNRVQTIYLTRKLHVMSAIKHVVGMVTVDDQGFLSVPYTNHTSNQVHLMPGPENGRWKAGYHRYADRLVHKKSHKPFVQLSYCDPINPTEECKNIINVGGNDPLPGGGCTGDSDCGCGPRGPPGPPGPPGTGGCGLSDALADTIQQQNGQLQQMSYDVLVMRNIVQGVLDETAPTGVCRPRFESAFGQHSCFQLNRDEVSYANALFRCVNFTSLLVSVQTQRKETYLQSLILNNRAGDRYNVTECFLTGAMYSKDSKWDWQTRTDPFSKAIDHVPFTYMNWEGDDVPIPASSRHQCVVLCVSNEKAEWRNVDCHAKYSFICEHPKICF